MARPRRLDRLAARSYCPFPRLRIAITKGAWRAKRGPQVRDLRPSVNRRGGRADYLLLPPGLPPNGLVSIGLAPGPESLTFAIRSLYSLSRSLRAWSSASASLECTVSFPDGVRNISSDGALSLTGSNTGTLLRFLSSVSSRSFLYDT